MKFHKEIKLVVPLEWIAQYIVATSDKKCLVIENNQYEYYFIELETHVETLCFTGEKKNWDHWIEVEYNKPDHEKWKEGDPDSALVTIRFYL